MRVVNFSLLVDKMQPPFCHHNKHQQKPSRAEQILRAGLTDEPVWRWLSSHSPKLGYFVK